MYQIRAVEIDGIPLLEHANLYSNTAVQAQEVLLKRLRADIERGGNAFKERFGKAAARAVSTDEYGFQLHPGKLVENLVNELEGLELAWVPDHPDDKPYRELHPAIGFAFLGAVAMSCAADRGLAVVGNAEDVTCRKLNQFAATCQFEALYDEFIHGKKQMRAPVAGTGERVADIILFNRCDASALTIDDLKDLAKERQPIRDLKAKLQEFAAQIPPMLDEEHLEQQLQARAAAALDEWRASRPSFRGALKKFFGVELAKAGVDLAKGMIGKAVDLKPADTTAGVSATGATFLGGTAYQFLGPIAGFGVGITVHAIGTAVSELTKERNSPYRYLSKAEKAGVVFSIGGTTSAAKLD